MNKTIDDQVRDRTRDDVPLSRCPSGPFRIQSIKALLRSHGFDDSSRFTVFEFDFPQECELMDTDNLALFISNLSLLKPTIVFFEVRLLLLWWNTESRWEFNWENKTLECFSVHEAHKE